MSTTKVTGMMQTGTKGGDIPSAGTLVIDTDGDYFDVTGTTGITGMTVAAGRIFTLQFDGVVTLTHGSTLYLNGAANFTTEAFDHLTFIAVAANDVRQIGAGLKDGGSPVVPTVTDEITTNSSAPVITTNPAGGVGTIWLRTTTGDMYVCTDATTNENVWTHVGGLSGDISPSYAVEFLVVAGGGGASGGDAAGGAGAGGFRTSFGSGNISGANSAVESDLSLSAATYTIVVGGGGAAGGSYPAVGSQGADSSISGTGITTVTSLGGAYSTHNTTAVSGGSGGGDGREGGARDRTAGAGTAGEGFAGGVSSASTGGSGGGGAGAVGVNSTSGPGGAGGVGLASEITGASVTYAGGGGGAGYSASGGAGGSSIGGAGAETGSIGGSGNVNTGSGGGGGKSSSIAGGPGGSGVVILRMATANYTETTSGSPTVTTVGSDTILKFTSGVGSYTA